MLREFDARATLINAPMPLTRHLDDIFMALRRHQKRLQSGLQAPSPTLSTYSMIPQWFLGIAEAPMPPKKYMCDTS